MRSIGPAVTRERYIFAYIKSCCLRLNDPPCGIMEIKINKQDLIKLKKLLHSKGNYKQGEKTTLRMGENNCKWNSWQRINLQNIQAAHTAQYQGDKQPNQKLVRRPKQTFLQRKVQMANKHMKRCSALLTIREMQIKTIMRYYLTPVRMAIIKKSTN